MVGAVVVDAAGEVAGEGFYRYAEADHAEVVALRAAGERARGGTIYVSLEPCCITGRTPPCTDAITSSGIGRVVCAAKDANPKISGRGIGVLREAGLQVDLAGEFEADARRLNEAFFHWSATRRAFSLLKTAVTLDGKIAAPDDNSGWITSETARQHVQQVRHDHDAILTGIGTVIADDPLLTDRTGLPRRRPLLRLVADSLLRIPLSSRLVESAAEDLVVVTTSAASAERRAALAERGVEVVVMDGPRGRIDLLAIPAWLGERDYISLMIEAGAALNWASLDSGLVDKTLIYYAPKILGGIESLPLAGGVGRRSRAGAIQLRDLRIFPVGAEEFAVEAYPCVNEPCSPGGRTRIE